MGKDWRHGDDRRDRKDQRRSRKFRKDVRTPDDAAAALGVSKEVMQRIGGRDALGHNFSGR